VELIYALQNKKRDARVMVDFLKWALTDGQKFAGPLGYAPLPESVVQLEMKALSKIKTGDGGSSIR
jgi:phosphate transport system substrate-binding protein